MVPQHHAIAVSRELEQRAAVHAALGDPVRLAIVESLWLSDRSPSEIGRDFGMGSNLLAHHLGLLRSAGCVRIVTSEGDRRRRYVQLVADSFDRPGEPVWTARGRVLFICTRNSARSQLAAALYLRATGEAAASAGTHPAGEVHRQAVRTSRRHGLDLAGARPRSIDEVGFTPDIVVTVCDRANEELAGRFLERLHWSIPDPVGAGDDESFEKAYAVLERRVAVLTKQ